MNVHENWDDADFSLQPLAQSVGPFPHRPMLRAWWNARGSGDLLLIDTGEATIPLHHEANTIRFVGEADLFDYHSPLGSGVAAAVADWAADLEPGIALDFDSLPAEAADEFMTGLDKAGLAPTATMHESSAVLELPSEYEAYLASLDKKQRHETRRKGRRFSEMLGEVRLERTAGIDAVSRFAAMHRQASGDKGEFMTADMEAFFIALHTDAGGEIDFLYGARDRPVAAAFGFRDESSYYLYNSAFDPDVGAASPGIVLVSELIREAIESGRSRFDFLKGDEVYKYRLGAQARPLWRVTAETGAQR